MKPVWKVLIVVAVVYVVVAMLRRRDGYTTWLDQEFETVSPAPFRVTAVPLDVAASLTARPTTAPPATSAPRDVTRGPAGLYGTAPPTLPLVAASAEEDIFGGDDM